MRILLTADAVGGVWDHSVTLAGDLIARGHDVTLGVLGDVPADRLLDLPVGVEFEWRALPLEWMPGGIDSSAEAAGWIDRLARRVDADVVHLNQLTYAAGVSRPTLVAAHSDVWSWFSEVRGRVPQEDRWQRYRDAVARGLAAAAVVVAPSRYQAELTRMHYGRRVDDVVWNGIDPTALTTSNAFPGARRGVAGGASSDSGAPRCPTLVAVGRAWDEAKGLALVDDALVRLGGSWKAYLAGESRGPEGQTFASSWLIQLGRLTKGHVWRLLGRADAYVSASSYEPFGLAALEAALSGCALVLSDIDSFREVWEGDALFFPKGSASGLADLLARLRAEPLLMDDMAKRAFRRASEQLTSARMTSCYEEIYQRLARGAYHRVAAS